MTKYLIITLGILLIGAILLFALALPAVSATPWSEFDSGFSSISEIRQYVKGTGIPYTYGGKRYVKDIYDCEDFTLDLYNQALTDNKTVGMLLILRYNNGKLTNVHLKNFTIIPPYIYEIEPQTGNVWMLRGFDAKLD